jgi:hypothetical protein
MGLFDTIIFNKSVIQGTDPKVDKYLTLLGENELGWQTKDFDCLLSNFFIEEGKLFEEKVEKRWVEENGPFEASWNRFQKKKFHTIKPAQLMLTTLYSPKQLIFGLKWILYLLMEFCKKPL